MGKIIGIDLGTTNSCVSVMENGKPKLAVYKFSSCDGCQLQLLNLEDELLEIVGAVEVAYFLEARRRELPPPYAIGLVEGLDDADPAPSFTTRDAIDLHLVDLGIGQAAAF